VQELGLPVNPDIPMLGFIGRLDYQKGIDLIIESADWLRSQGVSVFAPEAPRKKPCPARHPRIPRTLPPAASSSGGARVLAAGS
jgi:glycosyltransferase involved in cell wall biosynthesis